MDVRARSIGTRASLPPWKARSSGAVAGGAGGSMLEGSTPPMGKAPARRSGARAARAKLIMPPCEKPVTTGLPRVGLRATRRSRLASTRSAASRTPGPIRAASTGPPGREVTSNHEKPLPYGFGARSA